MDFEHDDEHQAVQELAARIFQEQATHGRTRQLEAAAGPEGPFDRALWSTLGEAGLLGIGFGTDVGGAGLDFLAVCLVLEQAGRSAAAVPVVATMADAGAVLERFGSPAQRSRWLPQIVSGAVVATVARAEMAGEVVVPGGRRGPGGSHVPLTTATPSPAGGWVLRGTKACVPAGLLADLLVVPARLVDPGGPEPADDPAVGLFVVTSDAPGVRRTPQEATARPEALVELAEVSVGPEALVGEGAGPGAQILAAGFRYALAARCCYQAGLVSGAMELVARYTATREQFGKPLASFQAVGQRAADAYVDAEAVRLSAWQAAWRLATGREADAELAIAKYFAAEAGQRVVHAAVHLHGGVGVDRDYPLHRYFLLTRQIELTLGGAGESLRRLGDILAGPPA